MAELFEKTIIKGMTLRNRLVRSATWEGLCGKDGRPSENLIRLYRRLAEGGVGLIVSGYAFVKPEGKGAPGKMGIHRDDFKADYEKMANAVHEAGGIIAVQIVHAGGQARSSVTGQQPVAPSAVQLPQYPEMPVELSKEEIRNIVTAFANAARRVKEWGFDAVQLHGAHGFLINQFLSPLTNHRSDEYGGPVEKRSRFLLDVYQTVRETVGFDFPVLIKLNGSDNLDGGLEIDDAVYAARMLSKVGIDAIEVSAGTPASGERTAARVKIDKPELEGYNLDLARKIKDAVSCPVMVVGGFRSFEIAEKAVQEDGFDYIALSRPLIREPNLPNRWRNGDRSPALCISCNGCFKPGIEEGGIYCVAEKKRK